MFDTTFSNTSYKFIILIARTINVEHDVFEYDINFIEQEFFYGCDIFAVINLLSSLKLPVKAFTENRQQRSLTMNVHLQPQSDDHTS